MRIASATPALLQGWGSHGCENRRARMLSIVKLFLFFMTGCAVYVEKADAEFLLYVRETRIGAGSGGVDLVDFLRIPEGDTAYDADTTGTPDFIDVDANAVSGYFGNRWLFDSFFQAFSSLSTNGDTGLPSQVVNIEFGVTKNSSENSRLEVLATFQGDNGRSEFTFMQMFGGGVTTQSDLQMTFLGAYNHDRSAEFFTNGYVEESTGTEFVFTFEPTPDAVSGEYDLKVDGLDPIFTMTGDASYSLTFGVRLDNLGNGEQFSTASGLDYVLPEPASIATWAVAVGLVGLAGKCKRKVRTL